MLVFVKPAFFKIEVMHKDHLITVIPDLGTGHLLQRKRGEIYAMRRSVCAGLGQILSAILPKDHSVPRDAPWRDSVQLTRGTR